MFFSAGIMTPLPEYDSIILLIMTSCFNCCYSKPMTQTSEKMRHYRPNWTHMLENAGWWARIPAAKPAIPSKQQASWLTPQNMSRIHTKGRVSGRSWFFLGKGLIIRLIFAIAVGSVLVHVWSKPYIFLFVVVRMHNMLMIVSILCRDTKMGNGTMELVDYLGNWFK